MNNRIFVIAFNTAREIVRQPIFFFIGGGGALCILLSFSFTLFAFGEELRMIKEMGVSTITICCLCLAALSAAGSVSKEIEKGTLITLLSKPVSRRYVIVGKFFGILSAVFLVFGVMSVLLLIALYIRQLSDVHDGIKSTLFSVGCSIALSLIASFLQVAIMCAIAIAGSIYLPMASNLCCCLFVYIAGNLIHYFHGLFQSADGSFSWLFSILCVFFPNLEGIGMVGMGGDIGLYSIKYVTLMIMYAILYTTFIIATACRLFECKECS